MARNDKLQRMKLLRDVALSVPLGKEPVPYEPNQFKNLSVDVADVLSKRDSAEKPSWVSMGAHLRQPVERRRRVATGRARGFQREGVLIEGLNADNPRWPFFRLSSCAEEILDSQKFMAVAPSSGPLTSAGGFKPGNTGHLNQPEVISMAERPTDETPPKAFISYSWDDEGHKQWVRDFAVRLRADGVEVIIDQWAAYPATVCRSSWKKQSARTATSSSSARRNTRRSRTTARAAWATKGTS